MIDREDMLELTRRMTVARSHFVRVAGGYIDDEGYLESNFNIHFLKLKGKEKQGTLDFAKECLISKTNEELVQYKMPGMKQGSIWQLLYALWDCELKNDALLMTLYDLISEKYPTGENYAIYVYYGAYDVPLKAEDKYRFDESEEVYRYLLVSIGPIDEDYNTMHAESGFLYPAFSNRSTDWEHVNIYGNAIKKRESLANILDV